MSIFLSLSVCLSVLSLSLSLSPCLFFFLSFSFLSFSTISLLLSRTGIYPDGVDVDIQFVNSCLKKIEGLSLHYNGFAFKEERGGEDNLSDVCILYRARAFLVDLGSKCRVISRWMLVLLIRIFFFF